MQTTLVALAVITVSYVLGYLLFGCSGLRPPRDRPTAAGGLNPGSRRRPVLAVPRRGWRWVGDVAFRELETRELLWRWFVSRYLADRAGRGRVDRPPGIGTFSVRITPAALAGRGQPVGEMVRPPQFNP